MSEQMTPQQVDLMKRKAEIMRDAEPGVWVPLPGGTEGRRIPDFDNGGLVVSGCWQERSGDLTGP